MQLVWLMQAQPAEAVANSTPIQRISGRKSRGIGQPSGIVGLPLRQVVAFSNEHVD